VVFHVLDNFLLFLVEILIWGLSIPWIDIYLGYDFAGRLPLEAIVPWWLLMNKKKNCREPKNPI